MKIGIAISNLLEKAGVDVSDEKLKDVFAVTTELPEEFAAKLDTLLMTKEAAMPLVKNDVINNYTKGVFINVEEDLKTAGLSKEEIDEVFSEKAFGKVVRKAFTKIAEVKEKSATLSSSDKEKLQKEEIVKLNQQLSEMKVGFVPKSEIEKIRSDWDGEKYNNEVDRHFISKKWSDNYPLEVRSTLAKTFLDKELAALGAKAVMGEKGVKIVKADDLSSDYFDNSNKLVTFESLADKIMLSNKLLAVSQESQSITTTATGNSPGGTTSKKFTTTQNLVRDLLKNASE